MSLRPCATLLAFAAAISSSFAFGDEDYRTLPLVRERETAADVLEVKLLSSTLVTEVAGVFENQKLVVTFGLKTIASLCETNSEILARRPQSSLDNRLNPSDHYFTVKTLWRDGCATGSFGRPEFVKFEQTYSIGQRRLGTTAPFPFDPRFAVHHYSFDAGMLGGLNRWLLFKLDFTALDDVKFDFVKTYSYVQGEVQVVQ